MQDKQKCSDLALICADLMRESRGRIHVMWLYECDSMSTAEGFQRAFWKETFLKYVDREFRLQAIPFQELCDFFLRSIQTAREEDDWYRDILGILHELDARMQPFVHDDVLAYIKDKYYSVKKTQEFLIDLWDTLAREWKVHQDISQEIIGAVVYSRHFLPQAYACLMHTYSLLKGLRWCDDDAQYPSLRRGKKEADSMEHDCLYASTEKYVCYRLLNLQKYETNECSNSIYQYPEKGNSTQGEYDRLQNWVDYLVGRAQDPDSDLDRLVTRINKYIEKKQDIPLEALFLTGRIHPDLINQLEKIHEKVSILMYIYALHREGKESYEKLFQYLFSLCHQNFKSVYEQFGFVFDFLPSEAFVIFSRYLVRVEIRNNYFHSERYRAFVYRYVKYTMLHTLGFSDVWKAEETLLKHREDETDAETIHNMNQESMDQMLDDAGGKLRSQLKVTNEKRPAMARYYEPIRDVLDKFRKSSNLPIYNSVIEYLPKSRDSSVLEFTEERLSRAPDDVLEEKLRARSANHMIDLSELTVILQNQKGK